MKTLTSNIVIFLIHQFIPNLLNQILQKDELVIVM